MSKHAYLILAHSNPAMLQRLLDCIDYPLNDIYIHWDAKSGELPTLSASFSKVVFTSKRVKVYWGDYSVVEAEYLLFNESHKRGPYQYYHLISGADLPIKTQEEIHKECDDKEGTEFIGFADSSESEINWRVNHHFIFPHKLKSSSIIVKGLRKVFFSIQDILKIHNKNGVFKKGSQWVSVTDAFVLYLLSKEKEVRKTFKGTFCPDEMYKQTLCWNSAFRSKLNNTQDEFEGCHRFIKWESGELKDLTLDDVPKMLTSDRWFARKFTPDKEEIIDLVSHSVN